MGQKSKVPSVRPSAYVFSSLVNRSTEEVLSSRKSPSRPVVKLVYLTISWCVVCPPGGAAAIAVRQLTKQQVRLPQVAASASPWRT